MRSGKPTIKVLPGVRPGQAEVCDTTSRQRYYLALADLSKTLEGEFIPVLGERSGSRDSWYEHELRYENYRAQSHLAMARRTKEVSA